MFIFQFTTQGTALPTIQFETFTNPVSSLEAFLRLDFTGDRRIRIDDGTTFGVFPLDQPFTVQVILNIKAPASTAHIVLAGDGASGEQDYTVLPQFQDLALQFGAIRVWLGVGGHFLATNIVVTRLQ
jgi:hypothetical protein